MSEPTPLNQTRNKQQTNLALSTLPIDCLKTLPPSSPLGGYHLDVRGRGKQTILDEDEDGDWDTGPNKPPSHRPPPRWQPKSMLVAKFIDDINGREKCNIKGARSVFTTRKEQRFVHAKECERFLRLVTDNAVKIGMRVNQSKTQLLCTTTAINYEV